MIKIALLGATGSIGYSTLDVVERHRDKLRITCVAGFSRVDALVNVAVRCQASHAVIAKPELLQPLRDALRGTGIECSAGENAIAELCSRDDVDVVLNALVGAAGVVPTLTAIRNGKAVALANKETLVCAGELVMRTAATHGVEILPVDSEHSALFQALQGERREDVHRFILTASGGPFRSKPISEFATITPAQALQHPTWKMGPKVTIDSSTLVNKGLELIEAKWLFHAEVDELDVVIHPQSFIHSAIEFVDGSMKAQLSVPDMKLPIQYALSHPVRWKSEFINNDLPKVAAFDFLEPDREKFPALELARAAMRGTNAMTAVYNAADEIAVPAFLQEKLPYTGIANLIERALVRFDGSAYSDWSELLKIDQAVRKWCSEEVGLC